MKDIASLSQHGARFVTLIIVGAVVGAGLWWTRNTGSSDPAAARQAYETLTRTEIMVNTDYELEDHEPLPAGFDGRIGRVEASYEGPDDFDIIQIDVHVSDDEAASAWERRTEGPVSDGTPRPERRPPYGQICTWRNDTVKCSVSMYEAVIMGAAGRPDGERRADVEASARRLLQAGVKNWLRARGLELPAIELS